MPALSEKDVKEGLARELARLILQMIEGNDMAYGRAEKLVKEHFPDLYAEFS